MPQDTGDTDPGPQTHQGTQKPKLKRLRGSCDECRRRKIACDSTRLSGNACTHCQRFKVECTHNLFRKQKKVQTQKEYIAQLESRIEKLENYIKKTHPGQDLDTLIGTSALVGGYSSSLFRAQDSNYSESISHPIPPDAPPHTSEGDPNSDLSEGLDLAYLALSEHLSHISIDFLEHRFFGQGSSFLLAKQVSELRREITGSPTFSNQNLNVHKRIIYWDLKPWELAYRDAVECCYVYPDDDLLMTLVSLFFEKTNCLIPILHQPTFMRSLSLSQHHWDSDFGMIVLMVCAIGSRYSLDPRVFEAGDASGLSSGWKYYSQIPVYRKSMLFQATIYDLQYYALSSLYLLGTSITQAAYNMLGIGLRAAWIRGVHRRRGPDQKPSVESELQKRAFWALVTIDVIATAITGRPGGHSEGSFDVEYPIECDDEYWEPEDPQNAFKQPSGKPCAITAFVQFIKLCDILAVAMRTFHTNKKSRLLSGYFGSEWERTMVSDLDSAMNTWKDSLPGFLLWDPNGRDTIFFKQTVNLYTTFYYVQIQIHRPFLFKKSPLSFASLAMCTNAARSCIHILETATSRGLCILPNTLISALTAGAIVALGLWGALKSGHVIDPEKELDTLQRCINVLKNCEKRFNWAGRLCDVLNETACIDEYHAIVGKGLPQVRFAPGSLTTSNAHGLAAATTPGTNPAVRSDEEQPLLDTHNQYLDRLFLSEMGFLQRDVGNVIGTAVEFDEGSRHPGPNAIWNGAPSPELRPANQTYMLWSDFATVFGSSEDWEAYLTSMDSYSSPGQARSL